MIFDEEITDLEAQLAVLRDRLDRHKHRASNDKREESLVYCLRRAAELGAGCLCLAEQRLVVPLWVVDRSLIETLFWCQWVSLSIENGEKFCAASPGDWNRVVRVNATAGRARFTQRDSGEDATNEALQKLRGSESRLPRVVEIAKQTKLDKVYDLLYRFLSTQVHPRAVGLEEGFATGEALTSSLPGIVSVLRAIVYIVDNRIVSERDTQPEDVLRILCLENVGGA